MESPRIELNPHPKMEYVISVMFSGSPGPFDKIEASVDYGVTDYTCVPEQAISGARILPRKHVPLSLRKIADTTYETEIFVDLLKDEDYFSKGVCRWAVTAVSATADRGRMRFMIPLTHLRYPGGTAETRYFALDAYQKGGTQMLNTGNRDRNAYPDPSKTFSISITARLIR